MKTSAPVLPGTIYFIYFFCGMTLCFEGVFLPEFKEYFGLNQEHPLFAGGCALIPVLQGRLADSVGLQPSYAIGFAAYLFAAWYTFRYREG